jgi:hypothetical protein
LTFARWQLIQGCWISQTGQVRVVTPMSQSLLYPKLGFRNSSVESALPIGEVESQPIACLLAPTRHSSSLSFAPSLPSPEPAKAAHL